MGWKFLVWLGGLVVMVGCGGSGSLTVVVAPPVMEAATQVAVATNVPPSATVEPSATRRKVVFPTHTPRPTRVRQTRTPTPLVYYPTVELLVERGDVTPTTRSMTEAFFRGGLERTGYYDVRPVRAKPSVAWQTEVKDGICSPPLLAEGTVYAFSCDDLFYAVDANTGAVRWTYRVEGDNYQPPAVVDGVVYFASKDAYLTALDAESGERIWRLKDGVGVIESPVIVNDVVYILANEGYRAYRVAIDLSTLEVKWRTKILYKLGDGYGISAPAYADGLLFADGNRAFDTATGKIVWQISNERAMGNVAVVDGVAFGTPWGGMVYAVDAKTGNVLWQHQGKEDPTQVSSTPTVANGIVFVGTQQLLALDAKTGMVKWTYEHGLFVTDTVAARDVLYVLTAARGEDRRQLRALDMRTGNELWDILFDERVLWEPAVGEGMLYLGVNRERDNGLDRQGFLYALR